MAFADPQTVTVNAVDHTLPRTSSGDSTGAFEENGQAYKLSVASTSNKKRVRRTARVDFQTVVIDPLDPTRFNPQSMSVYIVVDTPVVGFTVTEQKELVKGLTTWLTASSMGNTIKLLGGEN